MHCFNTIQWKSLPSNIIEYIRYCAALSLRRSLCRSQCRLLLAAFPQSYGARFSRTQNKINKNPIVLFIHLNGALSVPYETVSRFNPCLPDHSHPERPFTLPPLLPGSLVSSLDPECLENLVFSLVLTASTTFKVKRFLFIHLKAYVCSLCAYTYFCKSLIIGEFILLI